MADSFFEREGALWWVQVKKNKDGETIPGDPVWLADLPFRLLMTGIFEDGACRWLIEARRDDGKIIRPWIDPGADARALQSALLSLGVKMTVSEGTAGRIRAFLKRQASEKNACFSSIAERIGWATPDGYSRGDELPKGVPFVMPTGEAIRPERWEGETPIFAPSNSPGFRLERSGTLKEWRENVAPFIKGQPKGLTALGMAALANCARLMPGEPSGFSVAFCGDSSNGKSTWLRVAESWDGKPGKPLELSWNGTSNAMEEAIRARRDIVACVDEMTDASAAEVRAMAYRMNGASRMRCRKDGTARPFESFLPFCLISSERDFRQKIEEAEVKGRGGPPIVTGGQEARFLCPDIDTGSGFRGFASVSALPGWESVKDKNSPDVQNEWGSRFAQTLEARVRSFYGSPGFEWKKWLAGHVQEARERFDAKKGKFWEVFELGRDGAGVGPLSVVGRRMVGRWAELAAAAALANEVFALGVGDEFEILRTLAGEALELSMRQGHFNNEPVEKSEWFRRFRAAMDERGAAFFETLKPTEAIDLTAGNEGEDAKLTGDIRGPRHGYFDARKDEPAFLIFQEVFRQEYLFGMNFQKVGGWLLSSGLLDRRYLSSPERLPWVAAVKIKGSKGRFIPVRATLFRTLPEN